MTEPNPGAGGAQPAAVRSITVKLPTGQEFAMPAWLAARILEGLLRDDKAVYARHMMAAMTGEATAKPGRKTPGGES